MKNCVCLAACCLCAAVFAAAPASDAAAKKAAADAEKARLEAEKKQIQELSKTWEANRLDYGTWGNAWLMHRFGAEKHERYSDERLKQMETDGLAAIRKLVELRPRNADYRLAYGRTLMYRATLADTDVPDFRAAAKEALPHFRAAAAYETRDYPWAESTFWVAEAQYALGDLDGTRETLKTIASRNLRTQRRGATDWTSLAKQALAVLKGITFDEYRLPKDTSCRAFPEPQRSLYREAYTDLKAVRLELKGVKEDDVRVRLLKTKLNRLGVMVQDDAPFTVSLALDPAAPVDRPEGYAMTVEAKGARVAARDAQGVLWGVVSLLQVTDPERRRIRHCEILDWPDCPNRGYLGGYFPETTEFTLFAKHNSVDHQGNILRDEYYTPLRALLCGTLAREFKAFGLTLYYGVCHLTMYPQRPASDPRTKAYHVAQLKRYAAMGAGVYWPLDDGRYPLHPKDKETYGIGANFDARYVSELYRAVKKDYPDFKLIFCPPFYWGPDSRAYYPEDRENYLASLGRDLDPEIDVYWTGAQVKGYDKKPYQVEWFTRLTGHKPSIFQNGIGPHNLHDFLVDPIPWDKMHYKGFVKDIGHFHNNSWSPGSAGPIYTEADWLWNEEAYDAKRAVKAGVNLLLGPKMYDILAEGLADLSYFDKYKYGSLTPEIAFEDPADLERRWQHASNCWARAIAYNPDVQRYGYYGIAVNQYYKGIPAAARNPPDLLKRYSKDIPPQRELAMREAGADPKKGDLVYTVFDLQGLDFSKAAFGPQKILRWVKWMRGANTRRNAVSFPFECDPFPPSGPYRLFVRAMQDETKEDARFRIDVNGKTVFDGPCGFVKAKGAGDTTTAPDFGLYEFEIPFESMVRNNRVTISCSSPGFNANGTPYIGVNYVVLKKSK